MNKEQIIQFNELCARFLNWQKDEVEDYVIYWYSNEFGTAYEPEELEFHKNMEWLLLVKNKIWKLNEVSEMSINLTKTFGCSFHVLFKPDFKFIFIDTKYYETEIEAMVDGINQFLTCYYKDK